MRQPFPDHASEIAFHLAQREAGQAQRQAHADRFVWDGTNALSHEDAFHRYMAEYDAFQEGLAEEEKDDDATGAGRIAWDEHDADALAPY